MNIEDSDTVGDLKEVIKTEKELKGPADELVLWKVSHLRKLHDANGNLCKVCVPADRDLEAKVGNLALRDDNLLFSTYEMTEVFGGSTYTS